ncbi:hypothetical protein CGRA01v4_07351 [Colletotrichum graminicola]|nr:hypothetical protein CGRA01v4_07351 [Colletotrichum graminicola]
MTDTCHMLSGLRTREGTQIGTFQFSPRTASQVP